MKIIADLHIHSRFARACSKALTIPAIAETALYKGIHVIGTGDFTHPAWHKELERDLEPAEEGLYRSKIPNSKFQIPNSSDGVRFMLTAEVSCIYSRGGKVRRVHHLIFVPSFVAAKELITALQKRGAKLSSDGRPIIGLDSVELLKMVLDVHPDALLVPAHAWTPWFAVFGSKSGFDSLGECFGDLASHIAAIETGLSSDPPMNWRVSSLDAVALISNSDAHSAKNLGREANILELSTLSYHAIITAIRNSAPAHLASAKILPADRIVSTIEFYPEEGMYHLDGHRACNTRCEPAETKKYRGECPRCHLPLTVGVLNRVDNLADRPNGFRPDGAPNFISLVELDKIVAESFDIRSRESKRVKAECDRMVNALGNELSVLMDVSYASLASVASPRVVEAIRRVRERRLTIDPGFDGEYGRVAIFTEEERRSFFKNPNKQLGFLS